MPYDTSLVQTIRGMTEIPTTQSTRVTKCACCTSGLESSCNHESSAECNKIRYLYSANCALYLDSCRSLSNAVHSAVINRPRVLTIYFIALKIKLHTMYKRLMRLDAAKRH